MSTETSKQVVLTFIEAIFAADMPRAVSCLHEDIDFLSYAPIAIFPNLGHRRGKQQYAETLGTLYLVFSHLRHEIVSVVAEGDAVAVMTRRYMTKRANGRVVQNAAADFFRLRDGLIVEQRCFMDSFDAVQQMLEIDLVDTFKLAAPGPEGHFTGG